MTSRTSFPSLAAGMLIGALAMFVGLAQAGKLAPDRPEAVVALAQLLDAEHRRVDLMLEHDDVAGAIAALESLRNERWPTLDEGGEVAVELRHDAYGRLVRLRLDYPDVDPQSSDVLLETLDEGLGDDASELETNPFTARLTAMRGEVFELLDRDDDALSAYESALEMNRVLLERELTGGSP
jgi:Fe-S-cluster formation regulator IscX/YfhJ